MFSSDSFDSSAFDSSSFDIDVIIVVTQPRRVTTSDAGDDYRISMYQAPIEIKSIDELELEQLIREDEEIVAIIVATLKAGIV